MSLIPVLGMQGQRDLYEFKTSMVYIVISRSDQVTQ